MGGVIAELGGARVMAEWGGSGMAENGGVMAEHGGEVMVEHGGWGMAEWGALERQDQNEFDTCEMSIK